MTIEDEGNKTDILSQVGEEIIPTHIEEEVTRDIDTAKSSPRKSRTVPSSKTDGSVWLRYAPREAQICESEPSTES
jgi:hypothetical protein